MSLAFSSCFFSRPSFRAVLTHRLFRRMVRARLTSDQLMNYFVTMGEFCSCSRLYHRLPDALRELGHSQSAEAMEHIAASEEDYGQKFERMVIELIYSGPEVRSITERMEWAELQNSVRGNLLKPTFEVIRIFASRHYQGVTHVSKAIGIMLAVQMITRESIIPSETMVFVNSPHYPDFTLDHPAMAYLKEHATDHGAEAWHAALVHSVVSGELADHREEIDAGFDYACSAIATWYSAIEEVLFEEK